MSIFETNRTLRRIETMLDDAINGTFSEDHYDETKLSRLESRWKQYLSTSKMSMEQIQKERENLKALLSDISHQTKTPLANILLYTELLSESNKGEATEDMIRQIHSEAEKLEFLIQALVKMSRLESNILVVKPVSQKIEMLIERVVGEITPAAEQKHISVTCEEPEGVKAAYDLKWTAEALFNILDNAVKYSEEGSQISIAVKEYEMYSCILVTDQGIGIAEQEKAQIFKRFYRSSEVHQQEGTGIGLYLAREIIKKQGGYIKVQSELGEGSCFGIYLPKN